MPWRRRRAHSEPSHSHDTREGASASQVLLDGVSARAASVKTSRKERMDACIMRSAVAAARNGRGDREQLHASGGCTGGGQHHVHQDLMAHFAGGLR